MYPCVYNLCFLPTASFLIHDYDLLDEMNVEVSRNVNSLTQSFLSHEINIDSFRTLDFHLNIWSSVQKMLSFWWITASTENRSVIEGCQDTVAESLSSFESNVAIASCFATFKSEGLKLKGPEKILVSSIFKFFQSSGASLSDSMRALNHEASGEIEAACNELNQNLFRSIPVLHFTTDELSGCDLSRFTEKREEDGSMKHVVPLTPPNWSHITESAVNEDVRKAVDLAGFNKAPENANLLENLFEARKKYAHSLGFSSYSEYVANGLTTRDADGISRFLGSVQLQCSSPLKSDLVRLASVTGETQLQIWNASYARRNIKSEMGSSLDGLKEYFPLHSVLNGIMEVFGRFFGFGFTKLESEQRGELLLLKFACIDSATEKCHGIILLDLMWRDDKPIHGPQCWEIKRRTEGGPHASPGICAIFADFNAQDPHALLEFRQMELLFHELGHAIHFLSNETPYFSTGECELDFFEAPSQMLEYWVYEPEILDILSGHYLDSARKIPAEIITKLSNEKKLLSAYTMSRTLAQALFDHRFSSASSCPDLPSLWKQTFHEALQVDVSEFSLGFCSFSHEWTQYGGCFYSYLRSQIFAASIFSFIRRESMSLLLAGDLGRMYRSEVLSKFSLRPSLESVNKFLGFIPSVADYAELNDW